MYKDQLASEVWMDRFIDRRVQEWPDPGFALRECFYSILEKIVLGGVYDLFGESGGYPIPMRDKSSTVQLNYITHGFY